MKKKNIVRMFQNGTWVAWDGSDQERLLIIEKITLAELKANFPEEYAQLNKEGDKE